MKTTFYIHSEGDWSVGIPDTEAIVTIEDNFRDCPEAIEEWKELLADQYDTKIKYVRTEAEHTADIAAENKRYSEMEAYAKLNDR